MAKLWAIIKREYVERVRSKWFLIATFFGPIFFSAIIIVPAWLASRSKATTDVYNTTILDATDTGFGHRLAVNIAGCDSSRHEDQRRGQPEFQSQSQHLWRGRRTNGHCEPGQRHRRSELRRDALDGVRDGSLRVLKCFTWTERWSETER